MGFSVIPEPAISGFTGATGAAGATGPAGAAGLVQSVNGKSAASITLTAADVNALPSNANATVAATYLSVDKAPGNYRVFRWMSSAVSRWEAQVDDVAEDGTGAGSDFRLSARNDDGTFNKTVIHARRSDGTITFGTTTHHGSAQVTSAGALGLRDITADPATTTSGVFLYSKAGLPYIKQADGTVFQVGAGGAGAVSSVNTKTGAVVLAASDVNALPSNADGTSTGSLTLGGSLTAGSTSTFPNLRVGASGTFGGGSGSVLAIAEATTVPSSAPQGVVMYVEGGVLKVRQKDQTVVVVQNPPVTSVNGKTGAAALTASDVSAVPSSSVGAASGVASLDSGTKVPIAQLPDPSVPSGFTPEALGVKAWAGDPDYCNSGSDYSGVGSGRLTGIYINRSMTISKIVWHMMGYSGGLLTGSWAGIYDTAGTLKAATGDMSTTTYKPATQSLAGGGWSSSPLTSSVTLAPGVYYVLWRFNYTASPVDGPALARYESASTCQSVMGNGVTVWRHASYTTSATSAPSTITIANLVRDPIRFWVALA
ncbi:hypothetical protein [Streptomyces sp. NPDC046805]|uniref:hypothetical protein n=1 Tax=Streptomyces sp. NPDC046805 TaxID=3155134 RepID=UPI0033D590CD